MVQRRQKVAAQDSKNKLIDYKQDLQCNTDSPDMGLDLLSNSRKFFHRTLSIIY